MGKASGTGGRSAKGTSTSASATSTAPVSGKATTVGSLTEEGYKEIQDRYQGISRYDKDTFNKFNEARYKGIDLIKLDDDMRAAAEKHGLHFDKAEFEGEQISWRFRDKNNELVATMDRSFSIRKGERIMGNEFFKIYDKEHRGTGIAKSLLAVQLDIAKKAGIDTIAVHANIDVGGYTWARMGFQPDGDSLGSLCNAIRSRAGGRGKGLFYNSQTRETKWRAYTEAERTRAEAALRELEDVRYAPGPNRIAPIVEKYRDVLKPAWLGENWYGHINLRDERNYQDYYNYLHSGKIDGIAGTEKRTRRTRR